MNVSSALSRSPDTPWQDAAVCASVDPDLFFPETGGSTVTAKRLCRSCPVRAECLEYALANDERDGIWGGYSERERARFARAEGRVLRRCRNGLHLLTPENTIKIATCRACKQEATRQSGRRSRARQELAA